MGRRKVKGNMDIEIAVDALELAPHITHMVLFSGDGDFRSLVEAVQRRGVKVSVVSTVTTQPPMVADDLRRQCDDFIDLARMSDRIGRDPIDRPERVDRPDRPERPDRLPRFVQGDAAPGDAPAERPVVRVTRPAYGRPARETVSGDDT